MFGLVSFYHNGVFFDSLDSSKKITWRGRWKRGRRMVPALLLRRVTGGGYFVRTLPELAARQVRAVPCLDRP